MKVAKDRAKQRVTLNPLVIQKWAAPATGQDEVFDTKATMLALRVAAGGTRTLGVRARIKGLKGPDGKPAAPVRVTLRTLRPGQLLEDGDLAAVRREAWDVWEKCQRGQDPREAEKADDGAVTLRQAWERYRKNLESPKKENGKLIPPPRSSLRTALEYQRRLDQLFSDWLDTPLRELTRAMVQDRHMRITQDSGSFSANNGMKTFRAIYNAAAKLDETLPSTPTVAVNWNDEPPRVTDLSAADLPRWFANAAQLGNPIRRELVLLTLLSGSRPEVLREARLEQIDWKRRVLHIPEPKGGNKRAFDIPLSRPMRRCLRRAIYFSRKLHPKQAKTWVFASGQSDTGHIAGSSKANTKLGANMNDLRHAYIAFGDNAGVSELSMERLTNHTPKGVHRRYAASHALELHEAQEAVSSYIFDKAGPRNGWPFVSAYRLFHAELSEPAELEAA